MSIFKPKAKPQPAPQGPAKAPTPGKAPLNAAPGPKAPEAHPVAPKRPQARAGGFLDRLPPNSPEAERGALGCLLLDQSAAAQAAALIPDPDMFYDLRNQTVYMAIQSLVDSGKPVDMLTVREALKSKGQLDQVDECYLAGLPDCAPSAANLPAYCEVLAERRMARTMIKVCTEAVGRLLECAGGDTSSLVDQVEREVLAVRGFGTDHSATHMKPLVKEALAGIQEMFERRGTIGGYSTGLKDLDLLVDGLHPGELVVLAGYPAGGKTSLAMNIAESMAVEQGLPVGVFSLEMTAEQLTRRMLLSRSKIDGRAVRDGFFTNSDMDRLVSVSLHLAKAPIYVDDSSDLSVHGLRARARRMAQQHGVKAFVVDYLQLLNAAGGSRRVESRQQEVADVSTGLKAMAKELSVPVLVLSQLNDDGKLRESRAPGQDADGVWALEPPEEGAKEARDREPGVSVATLNVRKQRNGPAGQLDLVFLKKYFRFECAARKADEGKAEEYYRM